MRNKFKYAIEKVLICIIFCSWIGCSTYTDTVLTNKTIDKENNSSNCYYDSQNIQNNSNLLSKADKLIITHKQPSRIKYHKLNSVNRNVVIEGKFGNNGNKYPVVLDTGASRAVVLNADLVRKNHLPVYVTENKNPDLNGYKYGICQLSNLDIGEISLDRWPCIYFESKNKMNIFGIPIASSTYQTDNIILGLPLLREFKYIIFDDINKETELSYHHSFEPYDPQNWEKYPISIEEDFHGNAFLFVRFDFAGQPIELQLDTGSGRGLAIGERLWEQIRYEVKEVKLKKGKDFYPYIGNLSCDKGTIRKLQFGNRIIKNAEISVFSNDCPLLDGCDGLVGMQYFKNTVIVLDFEHGLMWLKKQDT